MAATGPGMSPSPQRIRLHLYQCSLCAHTWLEFETDAATPLACKCNTGAIATRVSSHSAQVDPYTRIELPSLSHSKKEKE